MGPKVTYVNFIVLWPSVLGQYFKFLEPKIISINRDLGSLKPSKVWIWVQYQNLMVLSIFKVGLNCHKTWSKNNLSQAYSVKA